MNTKIFAWFFVYLALHDLIITFAKRLTKLFKMPSYKVAAKENPSSEPPSLLTSLPDDILIDCVARVPRTYHSILSLVSKQFRSLVTSPELYVRRSFLGFDEYCLYVAISNDQTSNINWYTLVRKPNNKLWLVPIPSLPPMPLDGSHVVAGSDIYVLGGFYTWGLITPFVSCIDCRSHTVQQLTMMPKAVAGSVCKLIDGKIYVIGGSDTQCRELKSSSSWIMLFDIEAKKWMVRQRKKPNWEVAQRWLSSVEIAGKIYLRSYKNCYVYEPKEDKCETDEILHSEEWSNPCVVDDVLYYYNVRKNSLRAYDPKEGVWGVVKGVELGRLENDSWSCTASYGKNLVVFFQKVVALSETTEIWCAEIAIEKREDGEIWGKVERYDLVLDGKSYIMKCLSIKL